MPIKTGNGGHGPEAYDPNTGKYVEDGKPNSSYDNPKEKLKSNYDTSALRSNPSEKRDYYKSAENLRDKMRASELYGKDIVTQEDYDNFKKDYDYLMNNPKKDIKDLTWDDLGGSPWDDEDAKLYDYFDTENSKYKKEFFYPSPEQIINRKSWEQSMPDSLREDLNLRHFGTQNPDDFSNPKNREEFYDIDERIGKYGDKINNYREKINDYYENDEGYEGYKDNLEHMKHFNDVYNKGFQNDRKHLLFKNKSMGPGYNKFVNYFFNRRSVPEKEEE